MAAMFCGAAGAGCAGTDGAGSKYPVDVIETSAGHDFKITFFAHASLGFEYGGKYIYVDPVSASADYAALPKADLILITHEHGDHLDPAAIEALVKPETKIFGSAPAVEKLTASGVNGALLAHGEIKNVGSVGIEAVPAYNISPAQLNFHPKERLHNGYIITFGGTRVYVAGDSEDTPEMLALKDIDIAFLPVNQPYTMIEEQAARAILAIKPRIFYPYHTGQTDHKTDLEKLEKLLDGSGVEVRIRPME